MVNAGNRILNHWIYPIDKGYILIDTGYENGFAHFKKKLAKININLQQIRYIFLTHAHDDHAMKLVGKGNQLHKTEEIIFNCNSGGTPHQHCMDIMITEKVK